MITINLKPGSKRARAGSPFAGGLSALKGLPARVKDPWPMAAIILCGLTVLVLAWIGISSASKLNTLETEMDAARAENRRYRAFLVEKRRAEAARDSVVIQIATIRQVDDDRYVWPHVLDEVTRALPPYTWLTEVAAVAGMSGGDSTVVAPVGVQISGRTMDLQGFTRLMRQLEDSPWLSQVTMLSTQTVVDRGRAVTGFVLRTTYDRHGRSRAAATPGGN